MVNVSQRTVKFKDAIFNTLETQPLHKNFKYIALCLDTLSYSIFQYLTHCEQCRKSIITINFLTLKSACSNFVINFCSTDRRRRNLRENIVLIRMTHPPTIPTMTQTVVMMKLTITGSERNLKRTRFVKSLFAVLVFILVLIVK